MYKLLIGSFGLLMALTMNADAPRIVEAMDECESLWRKENYDQLYNYVGELAGENPKYVPARLLLAWREEQFGCQYEAEARELRSLTNQMCRILCEVNPRLFSRLGKMADDAERMGRLCIEVGKDEEYRRSNYDPRTKRSKAPYLQRCYGDLPFLVPDVSFECSGILRVVKNRWRRCLRNKALKKDDLGKIVFGDKISYIKKKSFMDDYVFGIVATEGERGMISRLDDEAIQLNGYCAMEMLRQNAGETKQFLEDYVLRVDPSIGADEAKRMAVWALLQFAHDDPEVASFLRRLPIKMGENQYKTIEYLKMAVKHLDEGCQRHFLSQAASSSRAEEDSNSNESIKR